MLAAARGRHQSVLPLLRLRLNEVGAGFESEVHQGVWSPVSLGWKIISLRCLQIAEANTLHVNSALLGFRKWHIPDFSLPSLTFVKVSNYKTRTSLRLSSCSRVSPPLPPTTLYHFCHQIQLINLKKMNITQCEKMKMKNGKHSWLAVQAAHNLKHSCPNCY